MTDLKRLARRFTEWSEADKAAGMHLPRILLVCSVILVIVAACGIVISR